MVTNESLYGVPREIVARLAELDNPSRKLESLSGVEIADLVRKACAGIAIALEIRDTTDLGGVDLPYDLDAAKRFLIRSGDRKSIHIRDVAENGISVERTVQRHYP
jgi:hypothetical protein